MTRKIKLTKGKYAIVDDGDYKWLSQWKWCVRESNKTFYAIRQKDNVIIYMHRQILGLQRGDGKHTDHINHNSLDNCRCNIRIVTCQQNRFNLKNVKGYTWDKVANIWKAQIKVNGKSIYLGVFDNKKDAHRAYLCAKKKYHKIN